MSDYNSLTELANLAPEAMRAAALKAATMESEQTAEEKFKMAEEFGKHVDALPADLRDKMNAAVVKLGMAEAHKAVDLLTKVVNGLVEGRTQTIHPTLVAVGKTITAGAVVNHSRMFILDGDSFNGTGAMKRKNFAKVAAILWRGKWMPFAIAFASEAWTVRRDKEEELGDLKVSDMPDKREVILVNGLTPTSPDKSVMSIAPVHRDAEEYIQGPLVFDTNELNTGGSIAHQLFATLGELVRNEKTVEQIEAETEGVTVTEM